MQVATYLSLSSGFAFLSALDSLGREKKKASEAGENGRAVCGSNVKRGGEKRGGEKTPPLDIAHF